MNHKLQTRGVGGYGSRSSAPPIPQRFIPMEHKQKYFKPSFTLGRAWSRFPEDMSQRYTLKRPYGNQQRLESKQKVHTPGGKGSQDKGE
ncbi:hypothetical protein O181_002478 [Austropuccinia psidii MF-1]|uniref:Uncharacterized protein n=1 Tax=Austropuccinia psidii MF-1 TaxID=1389203 RepID=A0A9Q3BCT4_9BASI|nr:hypothetical protein [Austropuccinia psidii MF-1]